MLPSTYFFLFFFFNDTATTEIYTLSLHDALPISLQRSTFGPILSAERRDPTFSLQRLLPGVAGARSEEHTSELQSQSKLVCRLLLEKKKKKNRAQRMLQHYTHHRMSKPPSTDHNH